MHNRNQAQRSSEEHSPKRQGQAQIAAKQDFMLTPEADVEPEAGPSAEQLHERTNPEDQEAGTTSPEATPSIEEEKKEEEVQMNPDKSPKPAEP